MFLWHAHHAKSFLKPKALCRCSQNPQDIPLSQLHCHRKKKKIKILQGVQTRIKLQFHLSICLQRTFISSQLQQQVPDLLSWERSYGFHFVRQRRSHPSFGSTHTITVWTDKDTEWTTNPSVPCPKWHLRNNKFQYSLLTQPSGYCQCTHPTHGQAGNWITNGRKWTNDLNLFRCWCHW